MAGTSPRASSHELGAIHRAGRRARDRARRDAPASSKPTPDSRSSRKPPKYTLHGEATFYDNGTTAMRLPRGTIVIICGGGGCIERVVNDYGPQKPSRIVDLYRAGFLRHLRLPVVERGRRRHRATSTEPPRPAVSFALTLRPRPREAARVAPRGREGAMSGRQIMTADEIRRATVRISHEIVEKQAGTAGLVLVGIQRRGVPLANRLAGADPRARERPSSRSVRWTSRSTGTTSPRSPSSRSSRAPTCRSIFNGRTIVLVDDVLYMGRRCGRRWTGPSTSGVRGLRLAVLWTAGTGGAHPARPRRQERAHLPGRACPGPLVETGVDGDEIERPPSGASPAGRPSRGGRQVDGKA